ncbi:hypothetical protein Ahy_A04g019161 [Arachis hypogaea]|uniref:Uncharacterized protein n=1 Tax=Arachis hypogaea TaxID=3818 RepID=A0A445DFF0_ARAHY|nr:hypothetical protein Ahy_A04g019161 [Arachis hypogaea]
MLTPCANSSRLKRKMSVKQTQCSEEDEEPRERDSKIGEVDKVLGSPQDHNVRSRAIFILENASLKKGLVRKEWKILNSHDDANLLLKQNKNLNDYGPDIVFESCVRAKDTDEVLIRVLEEPVTRHLPVNYHIIGLSYSSEMLVDIDDYVCDLSDDVTPVFVVGAMVNGKVKRDNTHDYISVSDYPLGAKCCVGLICDALEQKWKLF